MKRVAFSFAFAVASLALANLRAAAQDCPQQLEGTMGGVNYYYCQVCDGTCTHWGTIKTNSIYTCGGNCNEGCGGCSDEIPAGGTMAPEKTAVAKNAATLRPHQIKPGLNKPDPKTGKRPPLNSTGVDYKTAFVTQHPEAVQQGPKRTEITLEYRGHYFRCIEVTISHRPDPKSTSYKLYIGHELTEKPDSHFKPARKLAGSHYEFVLTTDDGSDSREFDVLSLTDLGN